MAKILILLAQDICFGLLDSMAYNFGKELNKLGIETTYFDIKNDKPEHIVEHLDKDLLAVVDFYSGILNINLANGTKLFDEVGVTVYQFLLDYPIYVENILGCGLKNYHALCMDRDYMAALKDFYSVTGNKSFFYPIPGKEGDKQNAWTNRSHDLVFVGFYSDYRDIMTAFDDCEDHIKQFAHDYFNTMINNMHLNHMDALKLTLDQRGIQYDNELLYRFFLQYGKAGRASRAYAREMMIKSLLDNGFTIDVYSDSWNSPVWDKYDNLIVHDAINEDEYLELLGDTKISLNCLYGNKAGFTERHGNSMLNGAISLTDRTNYLAENFMNQEDIIFYDLDDMESLPEKVRWILNNPSKAENIAMNAKKKAQAQFTWSQAGIRFLQILVGELEG